MGKAEEFRSPEADEGTWLSPPEDPLREVFTADVLGQWRFAAASSEDLCFRLRILEACGPYPSDALAADELRFYRAWKAAWETYLYAAFVCGMFQGERGNDLRSRLRGADQDGFRSAMAECEVCWFLAGRMRLPVCATAPGRGKHNLDMELRLPGRVIGVEVKAPFRERPQPPPGKHVVVWSGDDADKIAQCLEAANRQFTDETANILAILPRLRRAMCSHRRDLVKAAYGESKITFAVNTQTGEGGPVETKFFPEGKFLNPNRPGGGLLKRDGLPAYRRISIVLCIEEKLAEKHPCPSPLALLDQDHRYEVWPIWKRERDLCLGPDNEKWVDHDVLVLHNPYAYHPLPQDMWSKFPQFVPVGDEMKWTDGQKVVV
jgi:hypothetical protein